MTVSWPATLAAVGVACTFVFWGSYPSNAIFGGIGSILIGTSVLWPPGWSRLASPLRVAAGTFGVPQPAFRWGPIAGFTLIGEALVATGAFILFGLKHADKSERLRGSRVNWDRVTVGDTTEGHA